MPNLVHPKRTAGNENKSNQSVPGTVVQVNPQFYSILMESLIPNSRDNSTTSTEFEEDNNEAMASPSSKYYNLVVATLIVFSLVVGYIAAVQPTGAGWRYFSWHPFLMVTGFVGMMGTAAATKKLGGYKNTKIHGIMASLGLFMAFGGLYVIYKNKEMMGKEHLTSTHSIAGIVTMAGCTMAMMAGGIFLHPDFGVDKTNQTIRYDRKEIKGNLFSFVDYKFKCSSHTTFATYLFIRFNQNI